MDGIRATPVQNPILGLLSDRLKKAQQFAASPFGYSNPPAEILMNLLGVPAIQQTMERMAYGEPLTTGRGMTTKVRPEVAEAAMTLLPAGATAVKGAEKAAMAAGRAGERYAEKVVPQIMERGGAPAGLLESMSSQTVSPLTVYHGSPAKFSRFDPTKIGSGEGAQAYGYGHYVAQSPGVAKDYQRRLAKESQATDLNTRMNLVDIGGKPLSAFNVDMDSALIDAAKTGKQEFINLANTKKARWEELSADETYPFRDYANQKVSGYTSLLDTAKKSDVDYTGSGMLYEIDLPDEQIAKMISWDRPIKEQSKEIQDIAKSLGLEIDDLGGDIIARIDAKQPEGAERLRQAGIPGIRYFDAQSRGGQPATTENFVVFPGNEDLLTILRRNGGLLD